MIKVIATMWQNMAMSPISVLSIKALIGSVVFSNGVNSHLEERQQQKNKQKTEIREVQPVKSKGQSHTTLIINEHKQREKINSENTQEQ